MLGFHKSCCQAQGIAKVKGIVLHGEGWVIERQVTGQGQGVGASEQCKKTVHPKSKKCLDDDARS